MNRAVEAIAKGQNLQPINRSINKAVDAYLERPTRLLAGTMNVRPNSRVGSQYESTALLTHVNGMNRPLDYQAFYRQHLPHYQPAEGVFFVTYRLAFSLPGHVLLQRQQKLQEFQKRCEQLSQREQRQLAIEYAKILFAQEDQFLAKYQQSPQWLRNDAIANLVLENLLFHHTKHYELICALVMSNHVHVVLKPLLHKPETPYSLAHIMKDHKSYTAQKANKILDRTGHFWNHENYDHWVRDGEELKRVIHYILQNPVKAGIVQDHRDWPHYWVEEAYLR